VNESWYQLRQHTEWSEPPWVAFLFTSSTATARTLEQHMQAWLAERGQTQRVLRPKTPQDLREALPWLLEEPQPGTGCTWIEAVHLDVPTPQGAPPGPWTEAWDSLMLRANTRREQILKRLHGGLIFVGVPERKPRIREAAPDLWSIRALVLQPEAKVMEGPIPSPPVPRTQRRKPESSDAARAALERAEAIAERTGEDEAGADDARVRRTRILANLKAIEALLQQGWVTEAAPLTDALLALAKAHHADKPSSQRSAWLASALEYQSAVRRDQGDLGAAEAALREALALRKTLVDVPPPHRGQRRSELARTWSLIGGLALAHGNLDHALPALQTARDLRQELVKWSDDPESVSELAMSQSFLGDLHMSRGELHLAKQCFEDALEIRRDLASSHNAHRFVRYLSIAWGRLGLVSHRLGNLALARASYSEACTLATDLSRTDPGNVSWQMEASIAASRWADLALADHDLDLAEQVFTASLKIRSRLVSEDPENNRWQEYLAVGLGRMSKIHRARGDEARTARYAVRAARVSDVLAASMPDSGRAHRGRATAWLRLLRIYKETRDTGGESQALAGIHDAIEQLQRLGASHHVQSIREQLDALSAG
jgi:tetratricopeptide (TPR) repeat protein